MTQNEGKARKMRYLGSAVSDMGISKKTNQDSVCLKIAETKEHGQIAMCVLCDGMGGLAKGELASATVIRAFEKWFETELPGKLSNLSWEGLAAEWERLIKVCNYKIMEHGKQAGVRLGTTVSALLLMNGRYLIAHAGDSRIYRITDSVEQLTEDHTYVAREVKRGNMTAEQAKCDPKRNVLTQCVGASGIVTPEILQGETEEDTVYMLCSDGFRHELSEDELFEEFRPLHVRDVEEMERNSRDLVERVKKRKERDNISVALVKCEG